MAERLEIALVLGSIRPGRFTDVAADWVARGLARAGLAVETIDPAAPDLLPVQLADPGATERLRLRLAGKDAFVIVTPEVNGAMPGALKTLLDAGGGEWAGCPVGVVAYGGENGGGAAIAALAPVLDALGAVELGASVSLPAPWRRYADAFAFAEGDPEVEAALATLSARLAWWGACVRDVAARVRAEGAA